MMDFKYKYWSCLVGSDRVTYTLDGKFLKEGGWMTVSVYVDRKRGVITKFHGLELLKNDIPIDVFIELMDDMKQYATQPA